MHLPDTCPQPGRKYMRHFFFNTPSTFLFYPGLCSRLELTLQPRPSTTPSPQTTTTTTLPPSLPLSGSCFDKRLWSTFSTLVPPSSSSLYFFFSSRPSGWDQWFFSAERQCDLPRGEWQSSHLEVELCAPSDSLRRRVRGVCVLPHINRKLLALLLGLFKATEAQSPVIHTWIHRQVEHQVFLDQTYR